MDYRKRLAEYEKKDLPFVLSRKDQEWEERFKRIVFYVVCFMVLVGSLIIVSLDKV